MNLSSDQRFEAIKYRHEDQARLLLAISTNELKIYGSFLTLQLTLGGFLTQVSIPSNYDKIGLFAIDLSLAFVTFKLLVNLYNRRKEVVKTLKNCNEELGFHTPVEPSNIPINTPTKDRTSLFWFSVGLLTTLIGIIVIMFSNFAPNKESKGEESAIKKLEVVNRVKKG
jgi:hypothetical protein